MEDAFPDKCTTENCQNGGTKELFFFGWAQQRAL